MSTTMERDIYAPDCLVVEAEVCVRVSVQYLSTASQKAEHRSFERPVPGSETGSAMFLNACRLPSSRTASAINVWTEDSWTG